MSAVIKQFKPDDHYETEISPDDEIFTVAVGDAFDGIQLYGVFDSIPVADHWAKNRFEDYLIVEILFQEDEDLL